MAANNQENKRQTTGKNSQSGTNASSQGKADAHGVGQQAVDGDASFDVGFHILKGLKPITMLESCMIGIPHKNIESQEINSICTNATEMAQCLNDLWSIVKAQPKYAKVSDNKFSKQSSPYEVLAWLLRKLGALTNGKEWTVDYYYENGVKRYCFVQYDFFNSQKVYGSGFFAPIDFLPYLEKKDITLHNLIVTMLAALIRFNNMPTWFNHPVLSKKLQELKELKIVTKDYPNLGIMDLTANGRQQLVYTVGHAGKYEKLLTEMSAKVEITNIHDAYYDFARARKRSLSQREIAIRYFAEEVINLATEGKEMATFNYQPVYEEQRENVKWRHAIVWSRHHNDYLQRSYDDDNRYVWQLPKKFSITKPDQEMQPINSSKYPEDIELLFKYFSSHFTSRFSSFYYKNESSDYTPAELLLNEIIKNNL